MNSLQVLENQRIFLIEHVKRLTFYQKRWLEVTQKVNKSLVEMKIREDDEDNTNRLEIIEDAEQTIRDAKFFNFYEHCLILSKQLTRYLQAESESGINHKKYRKYRNCIDEYEVIFNAELFIEKVVIDINYALKNKVHDSKLLEKINIQLKEIEGLDIDSYYFKLYYFEILVRKYELEQNNDKIIETCNDAIQFFNKKRFKVSNIVYLAFSLPQIKVHIESAEFEKAEKIIASSYPLVKKYIANWYAIHSYEIIINFYKLEFKKVGELLNQSKRFPHPLIKERYTLYKMYHSLFLDEKIRIQKNVNELLHFSKDKSGYNVSIIIIRLLHLLKQKRHNEYIDTIYKTKQYIKEWLNAKRVYRSKYFLKILLTIPDSNFNLLQFELKSKKYVQQLKKTPVKHNTHSIEVELIPYDFLLEFVNRLLS